MVIFNSYVKLPEGIFHCQGLTTLEGKTGKPVPEGFSVHRIPEVHSARRALRALVPACAGRGNRVGNGFVDIGTNLPGNHGFLAKNS